MSHFRRHVVEPLRGGQDWAALWLYGTVGTVWLCLRFPAGLSESDR
jgi:hypothetical protein